MDKRKKNLMQTPSRGPHQSYSPVGIRGQTFYYYTWNFAASQESGSVNLCDWEDGLALGLYVYML